MINENNLTQTNEFDESVIREKLEAGLHEITQVMEKKTYCRNAYFSF